MARQKKVVDASIITKLFLNEADSEKATRLRDEHRAGNILLVIPELAYLEVLNALRYKGYTTEELAIANEALWQIQFHVEKLNPFLLEKASALALKYKVSLYDATYAALAHIFGIPLITDDIALQKVPNTVQL